MTSNPRFCPDLRPLAQQHPSGIPQLANPGPPLGPQTPFTHLEAEETWDSPGSIHPGIPVHAPGGPRMDHRHPQNGHDQAPRDGYPPYQSLDGQISLSMMQRLQQAVHPGHRHSQSMSTEGTAYEHGSDINTKDKSNATRKKKVQGSSQANGEELRRLFQESRGKNLRDLGKQVSHDEETARAEKSKQVFGMIWLSTSVVKRPNHSITRNKVYSSYVKTCTDHGIKHLNPASFGKLVHIIFEDLKTRRLGMRGLSKYHYVDLALIEDDSAADSYPGDAGRMGDTFGSTNATVPQRLKAKLSADTAYFSPTESNQPLFPDTQEIGCSMGVVWTQPAASGAASGTALKAVRPLRFASHHLDSTSNERPTELPGIDTFLPPGVDSDASESLVLVYRSHYKLAIDNFQLCRTALFRDGFKCFLGQLTRPGLDLLTHESIAAWIRECEWLKYQSMVPLLDRLLLKDVPSKGLIHMEQVAQNLCDWIPMYFSSQPAHIVQAMLDPARVFVGVLDRFLRVQRVTRDVVETLEMVDSRSKLWSDWVTASKPLAVISNTLLFHDRGHKTLLHLLTKEVHFVLSPEYELVSTHGTLFQTDGIASDFQMRELGRDSSAEDAPIVARLFRMLANLADRFNISEAHKLLSYVETVTGNITRNMALGGVSDLGKWWQIKLFIDEAMYWLAERGGMMGSRCQAMAGSLGGSTSFARLAASAEPAADFDFSRPVTAHSNAERTTAAAAHGLPSPDFPPSRSAGTRSATLAIRSPSNHGAHADDLPRKRRRHSASTVGEDEVGPAANDDSGIAMGLDDDFNDPHKYHAFVEGVHGSDPADVVVC